MFMVRPPKQTSSSVGEPNSSPDPVTCANEPHFHKSLIGKVIWDGSLAVACSGSQQPPASMARLTEIENIMADPPFYKHGAANGANVLPVSDEVGTKRLCGPAPLSVCSVSSCFGQEHFGAIILPLVLLLAGLPVNFGLAQNNPFTARTDYRNEVFTAAPTNAPGTALSQTLSVVFYSGNIGDGTNSITSLRTNTPNDGQVYLVQSLIGQPVGINVAPFDLFTNGVGTIRSAPDAYSWTNWFQLGQNVKLTAQPGRYYAFANWLDSPNSNQRTVVVASANSYTAIFTNTVPLETTNVLGVTRAAPRGTPLVLLNGAYYSNNIVPTTAGAVVTVSLQTTYTNSDITFTSDGSDPVGATLYTNPFPVTAPFSIRALAFQHFSINSAQADPVNSLTTNTPGGGAIAVTSQTDLYTGANSATLLASPAPGWTLMNWTNDAIGSQNPLTLPITNATSVQAIFGTTLNPSGSNGAVLIDPLLSWYDIPKGLFAYSSVVRLTVVPATGFRFVRWQGDASVDNSTSDPLDYVVTNAQPNFLAVFSTLFPNTFALTVPVKEGGTVSPHAAFYTNGVTTNLTASANPGHTFTGWYDVANGVSNLLGNGVNLAVTMNTNKVIVATFAITQPTFSLSADTYPINESGTNVPITVNNSGVLEGKVQFDTADLTAIAGTGSAGDYTAVHKTLYFTNNIHSILVPISIQDKFLIGTNKTFHVQLSNPQPLGASSSASIGSPDDAVVTILYNDAMNTNGSLLTQAFPDPAPATPGSLQVYLTADGTNLPYAQWRFPWQLGWRTNGENATNLVVGDGYIVDCKTVSNHVAIPLLPILVGAPTPAITNEYFPGLPATNLFSLTVNIQAPPPGAAWRFLGESEWRLPNTTADGLLPDFYFVEFEPVHGFGVPFEQAVVNLTQSGASPTYSYKSPLQKPVSLPSPVTNFVAFTTGLTNTPRLPYAFNGQLWSRSNGWASGFAVRPDVVLTAQHVMFNDVTLSFVPDVYWFFQQREGEFEARPVRVRGYYGLSGYDAYLNQWTSDVTNINYGTNVSSPASRELDVAALFFSEPPSRGGFGGYLSSDSVMNEWLTSGFQKILVGYPLEAGDYGYTNIIRGKLHATSPTNLNFALQNGHVYSSTNFLGLPGNSGGPLYVLNTNNIYYPAAVYLGTVNDNWIVRAIDSGVVDAINRASTLRDAGANHTGGGTILFGALALVSAGHPAHIQVSLTPSGAVQAGAAWKLHRDPDSSYSSVPTYTRDVTSTNDSIDLRAAPGWDAPLIVIPTNLPPDVLTPLTATYTLSASQSVSPSIILSNSGYAGGPLNSTALGYAITNSGQGTLVWSVFPSTNWLSVVNASGTLVGHATTNITVNFNTNAYSLPPGQYSNILSFINLTNGLGNATRSVLLTLVQHPVVGLSIVSLQNDGSLNVSLSGIAGRGYAILMGTNLLQPLSTWTTITNATGQNTFVIPTSPGADQRFYRAKEL
jgi:hypothetical protein